MPSNAFQDFQGNLAVVDEILSAAPGRGRPRKGHVGAVVKGGLVHLTAALEAYVEGLFETAVRALWPGWSSARYKKLFDSTTERFHNAHEDNTNRLSFNLGISWVVDRVSWQGYGNARVKKLLADTYKDRGAIAHGGSLSKLSLPKLRQRRDLIARYAAELDRIVAHEIAARTGGPAPW